MKFLLFILLFSYLLSVYSNRNINNNNNNNNNDQNYNRNLLIFFKKWNNNNNNNILNNEYINDIDNILNNNQNNQDINNKLTQFSSLSYYYYYNYLLSSPSLSSFTISNTSTTSTDSTTTTSSSLISPSLLSLPINLNIPLNDLSSYYLLNSTLSLTSISSPYLYTCNNLIYWLTLTKHYNSELTDEFILFVKLLKNNQCIKRYNVEDEYIFDPSSFSTTTTSNTSPTTTSSSSSSSSPSATTTTTTTSSSTSSDISSSLESYSNNRLKTLSLLDININYQIKTFFKYIFSIPSPLLISSSLNYSSPYNTYDYFINNISKYLNENDIKRLEKSSYLIKNIPTYSNSNQYNTNDNNKLCIYNNINNNDLAFYFVPNYSINNNYSHFLHGILRLFCSLLDEKVYEYDIITNNFIKKKNFTILLAHIKLNKVKLRFFQLLGGDIFHLSNNSYSTRNYQYFIPLNHSLSWNLYDEIKKIKSNNNNNTSTKNLVLTYLKKLKDDENHTNYLAKPYENCLFYHKVVYGSGCGHLLPPEKWNGYPNCRSNIISRSFNLFARTQFHKKKFSSIETFNDKLMFKMDEYLSENQGNNEKNKKKLVSIENYIPPYKTVRILFAIRNNTSSTGSREIFNIKQLESELYSLSSSIGIDFDIKYLTFEEEFDYIMDVLETTRIFISIHGASLTNSFFLQPGTAVLEIIPEPLCSCYSSDYFYGLGGYYHGNIKAVGHLYNSMCISSEYIQYTQKYYEKDIRPYQNISKSIDHNNNKIIIENTKRCNWKTLHNIDGLYIIPSLLRSKVRLMIKELQTSGILNMTKPSILLHPYANN